jgi:hypothetical protein
MQAAHVKAIKRLGVSKFISGLFQHCVLEGEKQVSLSATELIVQLVDIHAFVAQQDANEDGATTGCRTTFRDEIHAVLCKLLVGFPGESSATLQPHGIVAVFRMLQQLSTRAQNVEVVGALTTTVRALSKASRAAVSAETYLRDQFGI